MLLIAFIGLQKQLYNCCSSGNLDEFLQIVYHNPTAARELVSRKQQSMETTGSCTCDENSKPQDYLHVACKNGHLDIVQQIVALGVDVNYVSSDLTALAVACEAGHFRIVKFLSSKGAILHSNDESEDALSVFVACRAGHLDVVEFLISENPGILLTHGQGLLYTSCKEGHLEIVKFFLKKGVNINGSNVNKHSGKESLHTQPLHGACVGQQLGVIKYLIENGAEVNDSHVEHFWEIIGEVLLR